MPTAIDCGGSPSRPLPTPRPSSPSRRLKRRRIGVDGPLIGPGRPLPPAARGPQKNPPVSLLRREGPSPFPFPSSHSLRPPCCLCQYCSSLPDYQRPSTTTRHDHDRHHDHDDPRGRAALLLPAHRSTAGRIPPTLLVAPLVACCFCTLRDLGLRPDSNRRPVTLHPPVSRSPLCQALPETSAQPAPSPSHVGDLCSLSFLDRHRPSPPITLVQ